jgi:hypothetical protein
MRDRSCVGRPGLAYRQAIVPPWAPVCGLCQKNTRRTHLAIPRKGSWSTSVSKPKRQAFGIVGVNEGLANTTNPCLATEIAWALNSSGTAKRSKASFYLNTANPSHHGAADWPVNNDNPITGVLGMVAYFHGIGSPAGIYSLTSQWHQIAGTRHIEQFALLPGGLDTGRQDALTGQGELPRAASCPRRNRYRHPVDGVID